MHSFGFGVKMWAQALQKALDILFASPGNHSPGNEGLKDGIKAPVSKLQLQCWQGWNFPVSKEKHPKFKCLVSLAPALLLAGSSELFPLLGAIWDPEFCLLALSHAGVYKFSAFFSKSLISLVSFCQWCFSQVSLARRSSTLLSHGFRELQCDLWAALVSALNLFFTSELIVCKIVLCCLGDTTLFQIFPYFLTFHMWKVWIRSSVWCCCLSWRSPVDGGTGFCAAC